MPKPKKDNPGGWVYVATHPSEAAAGRFKVGLSGEDPSARITHLSFTLVALGFGPLEVRYRKEHPKAFFIERAALRVLKSQRNANSGKSREIFDGRWEAAQALIEDAVKNADALDQWESQQLNS